MSIVIFSDTHLYKFDPKKYNFLKKIISNAEKVIINGDFCEGFLMTFTEFINSPWNQLFNSLKEKKAVYIYGNHDSKAWSDERVSLFSDIQTDKYKIEVNGKKYVFEHGHDFDLAFHLFGRSKWTYKLARSRLSYEVLLNSERILAIPFGKKVLQKRSQTFNDDIKKQLVNKYKKDEILVCGHTHSAEMDLEHRFINDGYVRNGLGQYVVISSNGETKLIEEEY